MSETRKKMPEGVALNELHPDDQLKRQKDWDIATGDLLKGGADYEHGPEYELNANGTKKLLREKVTRLAITQAQYDVLHTKNVAGPELKRFFETDEGRQITTHKRKLSALGGVIAGRVLSVVDDRGAHWLEERDVRSIEEVFKEYFEQNGFSEDDPVQIDFARLDNLDKDYATEIIELMAKCKKSLDALAPRLARRTDLKIGRKVTVLRSPKAGESAPRREEWLVEKSTLHGRVRVRSEARPLSYKDLPINYIEELNPPEST